MQKRLGTTILKIIDILINNENKKIICWSCSRIINNVKSKICCDQNGETVYARKTTTLGICSNA